MTLATYQTAAERYRQAMTPISRPEAALLDRLALLVGGGTVLELGSGTGQDANYLEGRGLQVTRTDATPAFVEMMRADGHDARLLDVRIGEFGGPYDAVLANAVLLHLTCDEFIAVLGRARRAVVDQGVMAFTLKEGDGEGWSEAKLGLPRHFTYWREAAVLAVLERTGWSLLSIDHVAGRSEPWLFVLVRAA